MRLTWFSRNVRQVWDGFADGESELQQLTMNARSTPQWILTTHGADQFANLFRNRWPSWLAVSNLPSPE